MSSVLKRGGAQAVIWGRRSAGFATAEINFIKCKNIFSSLSKIDTHVRYNDATMDGWPGAVRARRDNVPGRGVTMRIVSSVTRILVYIVIIILGVLALAAPYALEYYEFEASTQYDLEAISIAFNSEFFTHALLPVGLFGCLSNIVALVFLSGKRKDKRYGKFVGETLAGIVVNIGRFIMALTVAICSRSFYFIGQSYSVDDVFRYSILMLSILVMLGSFSAVVVGFVRKRPAKEEKAVPAVTEQPKAVSAASAAPAQPARPAQSARPAQPVAPVQPVVPEQPAYAPLEQEGSAAAGWYDAYGGYYDGYGGYYDTAGGYYAPDGAYYPPEG